MIYNGDLKVLAMQNLEISLLNFGKLSFSHISYYLGYKALYPL